MPLVADALDWSVKRQICFCVVIRTHRVKKNVQDTFYYIILKDSQPQHNRINSLLGIEWLLYSTTRTQ